jgi:hypothetical protein
VRRYDEGDGRACYRQDGSARGEPPEAHGVACSGGEQEEVSPIGRRGGRQGGHVPELDGAWDNSAMAVVGDICLGSGGGGGKP